MSKTLSESDIEEILEQRKNGVGLQKLAKMHGVGVPKIRSLEGKVTPKIQSLEVAPKIQSIEVADIQTHFRSVEMWFGKSMENQGTLFEEFESLRENMETFRERMETQFETLLAPQENIDVCDIQGELEEIEVETQKMVDWGIASGAVGLAALAFAIWNSTRKEPQRVPIYTPPTHEPPKKRGNVPEME